jgi:hypothetical protein
MNDKSNEDIWKNVMDTLSPFMKLQKAQIELDEIKEKLSHTGEKCGNCDHWMKNSCKPEKMNKQFKSMNSIACLDFVEMELAKKFREEWEEKLKEWKKRVTSEIKDLQ